MATQGETGNNCCHVYNYKILYKEEGQQHFDTIRDDEGNEKVSRFVRVENKSGLFS